MEMGDHVILVGSERKARTDARLVGPADPNEQLTVSVEVRPHPDAPPRPDPAVLGAQRPRDRARIDRGAVLASYGASPDDLAKVSQFASEYGLVVAETSAPRRTVRLSGTVDEMNKAFGVQLNTYQYPGGTYRSREGHVQVPRGLVDITKRVSGLTNRPLARPHLLAQPQVVSSFNATQIGQMYNFPTGLNGAGVCIGIIELGGGYSQQDLDTYFAAVGLSTPNVVAVSVDGATNNFGTGGADGEVELDIEVAGSIAPGATIAVYFAPNTEQGYIDAITTAASDTVNNPVILSTSWGLAEDLWSAQGLTGMDTALGDAAAVGITVLAAAGDNGSNDNVYDGLAHCDFPASDPWVIACGGTTLQVNTDDTIDEIVWEVPAFGWATGGGVSDKFGLPFWQAGKGVPPSVNNGSIGRGVPDVTGDADPFTGYDVVIDGSWTVEGGTSAVAPLYAGLFALMDQSLGFPLGFITPYMYSLYEQAAYLDITRGSNEVPPAPGYSAGVGWDACSGLGRINGNNLLTELVS